MIVHAAPIARIFVRYVVGTVAGAATADVILGDPDLMNFAAIGVSMALGALTEWAYVRAKQTGGDT